MNDQRSCARIKCRSGLILSNYRDVSSWPMAADPCGPCPNVGGPSNVVRPTHQNLCAEVLEHFSIRLGVARVCEISFAFVFGNLFEKRGDCSPKFLNSSRLHFA